VFWLARGAHWSLRRPHQPSSIFQFEFAKMNVRAGRCLRAAIPDRPKLPRRNLNESGIGVLDPRMKKGALLAPLTARWFDFVAE
jgi:hypothetical protein